jgi:soluble lytic murein transglycosylase-like protein
LSSAGFFGTIGREEQDSAMLMFFRLRTLHGIVGAALLALLLFPGPLKAASQDEMKLRYDPIVKVYGRKYNVPADLIHSVIAAESAYNSSAVSPKGAVGLRQLRDLCRLYRNRTNLVLAAYNAGQEALKKYKGVPPYPETREYIRRVMASYSAPWIKGGTPIRKITSPDGKAIFTNDPYYHLNVRKDNQ